jgi:hypothetical protein
LPTDRESLQELGQRQIDTLGEEGFVDWIIANTSDFDWKKYFVFEGFRHEGCYKRFLALYPSTILVYCQIDIQTQIQRMKKRDGLDETKALSVLHHATEQSVEKLEQYATVLNNTNLTLENVVKIILTFA